MKPMPSVLFAAVLLMAPLTTHAADSDRLAIAFAGDTFGAPARLDAMSWSATSDAGDTDAVPRGMAPAGLPMGSERAGGGAVSASRDVPPESQTRPTWLLLAGLGVVIVLSRRCSR
ncbi:hypothetical protein GCM10025771_10820 [Niveibacterium umoris]|uniref:PEP-CTERM protein-sorting domain-containing protein n=1 Tax=Niveibacterium umoris TaxID=1193620 RepID=A0A840BSN0_9RHOO|nr:hypothetical protein [Niveibacterium umoris]MBB4013367.1 hypothetical protein [Niveibacterium umoris]